MPYLHVSQIYSQDERFERASHWLRYTFKIYRALRRAGTKKTRLETWRLAAGIFHCWVWGLADLPFDGEKHGAKN